MRKSLAERILGQYGEAQRSVIKGLIDTGEVVPFTVGDEVVSYIDPKNNPLKEAESHLDTLHKMQMFKGFAEALNNPDKVSMYENAIQRLHEIFPQMADLDVQYNARLPKPPNR